jgi:hypothetical protein
MDSHACNSRMQSGRNGMVDLSASAVRT